MNEIYQGWTDYLLREGTALHIAIGSPVVSENEFATLTCRCQFVASTMLRKNNKIAIRVILDTINEGLKNKFNRRFRQTAWPTATVDQSGPMADFVCWNLTTEMDRMMKDMIKGHPQVIDAITLTSTQGITQARILSEIEYHVFHVKVTVKSYKPDMVYKTVGLPILRDLKRDELEYLIRRYAATYKQPWVRSGAARGHIKGCEDPAMHNVHFRDREYEFLVRFEVEADNRIGKTEFFIPFVLRLKPLDEAFTMYNSIKVLQYAEAFLNNPDYTVVEEPTEEGFEPGEETIDELLARPANALLAPVLPRVVRGRVGAASAWPQDATAQEAAEAEENVVGEEETRQDDLFTRISKALGEMKENMRWKATVTMDEAVVRSFREDDPLHERDAALHGPLRIPMPYIMPYEQYRSSRRF